MAINFPDSPTNGQTHAVGSFTWQYDGEKWVAANGIALDGLSDVTAPTPTSGDFLKWNGTAWVNDAIDLGTDTTGNYIATISGTANQISVTGSGSESAAVTIGLPSDVTIANDLTVTGNLTVNGTTTTLNTETLSVEDNIVILNSGVTGSPTTNAGVEVERGTSTNVLVRWNETNDKWEFTNDGTTYGNIAALGTIALGTDTTGNYVSDISSGTGISVTHTPSEGSTGTVAIDTAVVPQLASANTFTTNQIISGSTSTDLLRITQTGAGNALLVEDDTNPDSTPFVIDASGRVGVGMTAPGVSLHIQNATQSALYLDTTANNNAVLLRRSSGTFASPTTVGSGELLGIVGFSGHDGASYFDVAQVRGAVDAAVSTGIVPGRLNFLTTNSSGTLTERMRIDSSGQVGIGGTPAAGRNLVIGKSITGSTSSISVLSNATVASDVTTEATGFRSTINTSAASFTLTALIHFLAAPASATPGAGSTITNQYGFYANTNLTGATNNYAFYGDVTAATGRYNLYMAGAAANYMAGRLGVGATLTSGAMAQITNTTAADKAFIIKGAASQTGDLVVVQNSANTKLWHINSSNSIGHGVTTATTTGFIADAGLVAKTSTAFGPQYVLGNKTNDANAGYVIIEKDRAGAIVASGDFLGNIQFRGYDGANYRPAAMISGAVDSAPGIDDMPGRLTFLTAADGSFTLTERMRIDSAGQVGIGTTPAAGRNFVLGKAVTGSASSFAMLFNGIVQSDVTTEAVIFRSSPSTAASSFVIPQFYHYQALGTTIGATSSITHQYGYFISSTFTGATNNYGFYGDIASGTNRWNFYANGTAANYMAGRLGVGATNTTGSMVQIVNTTAADDVLTIKGAASQTGFLTEWMNSANSVVATMSVAGAFTAVTKSFVIDHPTKNGKKLRYASLEGPENGVYVRGKSSGVIELPDYWAGLVDEDSITVQVTPIGKPKMLFVENISISNVVIGGSDETEFFYFVQAERKDVEKLVVEYDSQL